MYMGRSIPGGGTVSEDAFRAFLDAEVTPRFPEGLTVLDAQGRWRSASGRTQAEASKVVVLILPSADAEADARLQAVRQAYQQAFHQESVLITAQPLCAAF